MTFPSDRSESEATAGGQGNDARSRTLFDWAPIGILYADPESYYLDANECMCRMLGYAREEIIGMHASQIVAPVQVDQLPDVIKKINKEANHRGEWIFRRKDGTLFPVAVIATKFPDGTLLGLIQDITLQREQQAEIDRMARLYAALSQVNQAIVWSGTRDALFSKVCEVLVHFGGLRMAWIGWNDPQSGRLLPVASHGYGTSLLQAVEVYSDDRAEGRGPAGTAYRTGRSYICNRLLEDPATMPWRAGLAEWGFLACAALPVRVKGIVQGTLQLFADREDFFNDKEIALLEEAATDISFALDNFEREEARRAAEEQLRNEKLFSDTMIESMPGILYFYDADGRFLRWNRNFESVSGYSGEEILRMHPRDFFAPAEQPLLEARISEVFSRGESSVEANFLSKDGTVTPYFFTGRRIDFQDRSCLVGVGIDISERKRAEAELGRSTRLLRAVVEGTSDAVYVKDRAGKYLLFNQSAAREVGMSVEEVLGKDDRSVYCDESASIVMENDRTVMESGAVCSVEEHLTVAGTPRVFQAVKAPYLDDAGAVIGVVGVSRDISEQRSLEEQLRQSQKMDAIGRLAGGVAHDFNNLLTIISGHSELLHDLPGATEADRESTAAIRAACDRATSLTRQLLGFSRQTMLQPRVLDLNDVVTETGKMLQRLIGEDIQFSTVLAPDLSRVKVDPGQLDQVLMNLAVNARDAMPRGGVLTLETANIVLSDDYVSTHLDCKSGPHVVLIMTDTGCGMSREVQARIFEPFFTTKEAGKGTGLGLAMVFGIVRQSGGCIHVYSEPERGTTFKIYLPAVEEEVADREQAREQSALHGTETVLLVEDDHGVRGLAVKGLERFGYSVISAPDGIEAIKIAESIERPLDLLLTDVVMPNMGGAELADILQGRNPALKVLFTSGYTDDAVVRHGLLEAHVHFIQKPYTPRALAQKIREVLDGAQGRTA